MNKKLMAVAVAGALGSPALVFAQASTVQLYGQVQIEYASQDAGGVGSGVSTTNGTTTNTPAAKPTRDALINTTSYWGIKGEEALGGGLSAWFQMEQNMPINGTTNFGNVNAVNNPNATTTNGLGGNVNANVAGAATAGVSPGLTGDRNTAIGLKGGFGNFYFGSWYTPLFISQLGAQLPGGATSPQGWAQIMGNGQGTGNNVTNNVSFARRQLNSLSYESPSLSGFTVNAMWSASNEKTAATTAATSVSVMEGSTAKCTAPAQGAAAATGTATNTSGVCTTNATASPGLTPRLWGLSGRYDNGPLYVSLGYESHNDYNPGNIFTGAYTGGRDSTWELRASYLFGGVFKLLGAYERTSYNIVSGCNLDKNSWFLGGDWNIAGPHALRAMYQRGQSTSGTAGAGNGVGGSACSAATIQAAPGAAGGNQAVAATTTNFVVGQYVANGGAGNTGQNLWTLEYAYSFSKRTSLYLDYARMSNDSQSVVSLNTFATPNPGATQTNYGVGLRHKF